MIRCGFAARSTLAALLLILASATSNPLRAQKAPSEVTDQEIVGYKGTIKKACMEPGIARGDPQERVEAFCSCVVEVLEKSMSRSEWQQAYFYSLQQKPAEEKKIVAPHFSKLEVCRPK